MSKPTRPQPPRGLVAAIKHPVIQQARPKPMAPPVYRPQPTPKVLQRKTAQPQPPVAQPKTVILPSSKTQLPPKPVQVGPAVPNHRPAHCIPPMSNGRNKAGQILQCKLTANDKDAVVPMVQTADETETNKYKKTSGDKEINGSLDPALRKRIYLLVDQNKGSSRYTSAVSVNLNKKTIKIASGENRVWEPGPEFKPVQIICQYDMVGAAHGGVPTPHVKIVIRPGNKSTFELLFGNRVVELSGDEVKWVLNYAAQDYLLPWVQTSVEKALAAKNFGTNTQSDTYKIK